MHRNWAPAASFTQALTSLGVQYLDTQVNWIQQDITYVCMKRI